MSNLKVRLLDLVNKAYHSFNYFIFFLWFSYFVNFQVEATLFEKMIVFFFVVKSTSFLYDEYFRDSMEKLWKTYINPEEQVLNIATEAAPTEHGPEIDSVAVDTKNAGVQQDSKDKELEPARTISHDLSSTETETATEPITLN